MIDSETWKVLESIEDGYDRFVFRAYLEDPTSVLVEMANVLGNEVKPNRLPFSFYFSDKETVHRVHGIRVKILWNPSKMSSSVDGILELHGDYSYTTLSHKYKPTGKELSLARDFFKANKVLFAAVWEGLLDPSYVQRYLFGDIKLNELLTKFTDIKEEDFYKINHCKILDELEMCVRENKIFNMND